MATFMEQVEANQSELYTHSGIKGQKWGVRRYQKEDGSLTEEGKIRYAKEKANNKDMTPSEFIDKEKANDRKDLSDITKNSSTATKALSDSFRNVSKSKAVRKDYSKLSDQEMRNVINRIKLEREYGDLTGQTKYVQSGKDKLMNFLGVTTGILTAAGAALGIIGSLKSLGVIKPSTVKGDPDKIIEKEVKKEQRKEQKKEQKPQNGNPSKKENPIYNEKQNWINFY